ncbi:MAG TPA: gluconate 2-dehydrogenase subunit 3 family protein [Hyphomonadaceae bacterium]|nr:gluconate 2-dehydrogenase subunit 3 family protein [Hyphomonadaceae bacterium]
MTDSNTPVLIQLDRRMTLRWIAASIAAGQLAACGEKFGAKDDWLAPAPLTGNGYGKDPNLQEPVVPWPLTMTKAELAATAALADLILPADGDAPSASKVGVPAFINEWVSAPYPDQQEQRALIIPGLAWLDKEAAKRGGQTFAQLKLDDQKKIADDIAFKDKVKPGYEQPAKFFARMRALTMGAYYTTPEGWKVIGYPGNTPVASGPYPGPTPEALAHIKNVIEGKGLKMNPVENGPL